MKAPQVPDLELDRRPAAIGRPVLDRRLLAEHADSSPVSRAAKTAHDCRDRHSEVRARDPEERAAGSDREQNHRGVEIDLRLWMNGWRNVPSAN